MIDLSIVIPTFRTGPLQKSEVLELLRDIQGQLGTPDYEVLVVANPPDPQLEKEIAPLGHRFQYLSSSSVGANHARNVGLAKARGGIILFLDDDCRLLEKDFLQRHWRAHSSLTDASAVGGPYLPRPQARAIERAYHLIQTHWLESGRRQGRHVSSLFGGNFSIKADILRANGFDESIIFGGTETELFSRLEQAGHRFVLCEDLSLEHRVKLTLPRFMCKAFLQGVGSAYLVRLGRSSDRPPQALTHLSARERVYVSAFEFAFACGYNFSLKRNCLTASPARIWMELFSTGMRNLARLPHNGYFTALFFSLKAALKAPAKHD